MTNTKTIKISEENYEWLCELAGDLQKTEKRTISIDKALSKLYKKLRGDISDMAGAWKMDDKEAEEFKSSLKQNWKKWKISV